MRDAVYILRNRSRDEYSELRYSIRTLKNITGWSGKIFIVGGFPVWGQNMVWIPAQDRQQPCYSISENKQINALNKIRVACESDEISDDFILMNDDFFIIEPTNIEYFQKGNLKDTVVEKEQFYHGSRYWCAMKRTAEEFDNPFDFELHFPIIYNKKRFLDLMDKYDMYKVYLHRSLYCNHYGITGPYLKDNKAYTINELMEKKSHPFFSTGDKCGSHCRFVRIMDGILPEKSTYEKW